MKPFLITFRSAKEFELMVQKALQSGYAIDNAPFVYGELLCQWVKPMHNYYEWRLAVGVSLSDLQAEVQNFCSEGFDFLYPPLAFGDVLVQWVQRWKTVPEPLTLKAEQKLVEGVANELKSSATLVAEIGDGGLMPPLRMVVGVQPMQLVERGELFSSSKNPFTINLGGRHE